MCEAFATSVASNLVSKLGEYLIAPIGRQFGYVLFYKSYVKDLENGVEELKTRRDRVQRSVQEAEHNRKPIHKDIKNWLESVEKEAEEARNLLKHGESAKNAFFRGWIPNPVVRHPIGRKVKKMIPVIQGLHENRQIADCKDVYYENPPIGKVPVTPFDERAVDDKEDVLDSRASIIKDIMKALADDKVCVIGVYGPGGIGKSKLLKDVERRVNKDPKPFDWVVKANVPRDQDIRKIQDEIIDALGLHLLNEKTVPKRAHRLREWFESASQKNILIILDNLWEKLELEEIGIPCGDDNKVRGCKLLLSSRNRDVLRTHMGSDREFPLNVLEHGEAQSLFERTVGDRVNNPEFKPWVDGVVKNCGGLPLMIVTLAKMLKHNDLAAWMNASTNRDLSDVESLVKLSYNHIKDGRIRSLFLICALTSGRISTRDSLIYCMGLGLFKDFNETIQRARYRLIVDLRSLQDSSLLLDNDDRELFRMHDLFADVAISIASTEWNALVGRKGYGFKLMSKDELRNCAVLSFPYVAIDELPANLDCPNLRMLLLLEHNPSLKIPDSFFESMEKLQVLGLTGLSFPTLPPSIEFLENLKSLSLDQCYLQDVTVLGKLKGLQFLSFNGSKIARLPKEIGELTELRFLDLTGCYPLEIIEPGVLGRLVNLEELYIDRFHKWEAEDEASRSNASLAELKNMKKLSTLYISIPHSTNLSSDLPFGNLNEHKIQIGVIKHWRGEYKESRTLKLKLDSGNLLHEVRMQECLGRTQDLCLDGLQDVGDSIHDLCTKGFHELKHLHVKNNISFQYVVDSTRCPAFTRLESLILQNLSNLKKICRDCLAPESFSNLKIVKVEDCGEIKHLFPLSMTRILQLEEIEITRCHLMQQIVADAEADEYRDEIDDDANVMSCKLRRLTLQNLPEMMSFYKTGDHSVAFFDGQQVEFPHMELMKITHMDKMEKIWLDDLASNAFSKLKTLVVEHCEKLSSIFSSYTMLTRFHNLEEITVTNCGSLEVIFHVQEFNFSETRSSSTFHLRKLVLKQLPKMKHVWSGHPYGTLTFECLRRLEAVNCKSLKSLFPVSIAKSMTQLEVLIVQDCGVEEIIAEEDGVGMSAGNLFFPRLTDLRLLGLPELRSFYKNSHTSTWPLLKQLRMRHCSKMGPFSFACEFRSCQGTTTGENQPALFSFEKVMPNLKGSTLTREDVARMQQQPDVFGNLKKLDLACYHDENVAFPSNFLLQRFPNLEELLVGCSSFEEIFSEDASGHGGATPCGGLTDVEKPLKALGNLKRLGLGKLCNLRRVWRDGSLMAEILKQIKVLVVVDCSSLSIVFPSPTSFQSLTHLGVQDCDGLIHMGTCSAVTSLVHLTWLTLRNCGAMKDVVTDDGNGAEEISFPKLEELILDGLPSLESFSRMNCAFKFPSLVRIVVTQCPKMNIFCKGALRTPNLDKVLLSEEVAEGHWEGDLNTTVQTLLA